MCHSNGDANEDLMRRCVCSVPVVMVMLVNMSLVTSAAITKRGDGYCAVRSGDDAYGTH